MEKILQKQNELWREFNALHEKRETLRGWFRRKKIDRDIETVKEKITILSDALKIVAPSTYWEYRPKRRVVVNGLTLTLLY